MSVRMLEHHEPIITDLGGGSFSADCSCGWRDDDLWGTELGARTAWLQHVWDSSFPEHYVVYMSRPETRGD